MGLQSAPGYIGTSGYLTPVELDRNFVEGLFPRSGILRAGDFAPTALVGSGMVVSMAGGRASILGVENAQQGAYFVWSDAAENLTFPSPSGSPRIDSLIMRVKDSQYGSISGTAGAEWFIATGVPAGSPVPLADSVFNVGGASYQPGAWYRVLNVTITPGDIAVNPAGIVDLRVFADQRQSRVENGYVYGGRLRLTSSSNFVKATYPDLKAVYVECQGGGGGGGGAQGAGTGVAAGAGGGSGGWADAWIPVASLGSTVAYVVGTGGPGSLAAATATSGGASNFGTFVTGGGGGGGGGGANTTTVGTATGGAGGANSGSNVGQSIPGMKGGFGRIASTAEVTFYGVGGNSPMGMGAPASGSTGSNGVDGTGNGSGGGGAIANTVNRTGGAGQAGVILVDLYF